MKKLYSILLLAVLAITISCTTNEPIHVGNTPFDLKDYNLISNIQSIKETKYSVKFISRIAKKSKKLSTDVYDFNKSGQLRYHKCITLPSGYETVEKITYDESGRYIKYDGYVKYGKQHEILEVIPNSHKITSSENGDVIKETYDITGGINITNEYTYDFNGNVLTYTNTYSNPEFTGSDFTTTTYNNNKRVGYSITHDTADSIASICDSMGNVIVENTYDYDSQGETPSRLKATFLYEYDKQGNWVKCVRKEKYTKSITEREIKYYTTEEMAIKDVNIQSKANIIFPTIGYENYFPNAYARFWQMGYYQGLPKTALLITLLILTIILVIGLLFYLNKKRILDFSKCFKGLERSNGMKMKWMYSPGPYYGVGSIALSILLSFVVSILFIFIFGGATWVVFWIIKILLYILVILGWIMAIGGGLGVWGSLSDDGGGCGTALLCVLVSGLGIFIIGLSDEIYGAGELLVTWGFDFMNNINMFNWGIGLFANYWDIILLISFSPIALFLIVASVFILLNVIFISFEYFVTRIYSIRRPCSSCGSTATPNYLLNGKEHPVALRPGLYGTFFQKSPITGEMLPTMLINGKGKLTRSCSNPKCKNVMKAEVENTIGTEIHIGIVGQRSSGKSYLLYSGLSLLKTLYKERMSQIDTDDETSIEAKKKRISSLDGIQTDASSRYRAVQLIFKQNFRPLPYHLFFYDVAGEKFDVGSKSHETAMEFYTNVQTVVFIIDPCRIDFSGVSIDPLLQEWLQTKGQQSHEQSKVEGSFAMLKEIIKQAGRNSKKIDFNFVCVKKDLGYLQAANYKSEGISSEQVEEFMRQKMGLNNLVNSAKAEFSSINFYAVSAISSDTTDLKNMFINLLKQRSIKL